MTIMVGMNMKQLINIWNDYQEFLTQETAESLGHYA